MPARPFAVLAILLYRTSLLVPGDVELLRAIADTARRGAVLEPWMIDKLTAMTARIAAVVPPTDLVVGSGPAASSVPDPRPSGIYSPTAPSAAELLQWADAHTPPKPDVPPT